VRRTRDARIPNEHRSMTRSSFDPASAAATAFAAGILLIGLTGCSQIANLIAKQHEESYPTYEAAARDWVGVDIPGWIPEDATDLRNLATNDETVSVIRVVSDSPLPADCTTEDRHGIPTLAANWSTQSWPDEVQVCGDYEVMPMTDGWLGWFNATEPGQTPS
jgi:hypothetical protein